MMKEKKSVESKSIVSKLVQPNDTNQLGNLFGGSLLAWMDEICFISAQKHCSRVSITASVNHVSFKRPIHLGNVVTLEAQVSRAFNSSMEVYVDVYIENLDGNREKCNEAIFVFVAVDQSGRTIPVPPVVPETEIEIKRFEGALRRKELSLVLAGKMDPSDAKELKSIFD
jgi:acyl-CoA hydrolase